MDDCGGSNNENNCYKESECKPYSSADVIVNGRMDWRVCNVVFSHSLSEKVLRNVWREACVVSVERLMGVRVLLERIDNNTAGNGKF